MHEEIIVSGFGGQGALFAGQLLTYTGMDAGYQVTWIPSYGPEMRGGTAHCTVILSDDPIGSPIIRRPTLAIVMNPPSMEKYEALVKPGGVLVVNSTLVREKSKRDDLGTVYVPANDLATELGNVKMANVVLLGALLATRPILSVEALKQAMEDHIPERRKHIIEPNKRALDRGIEYAQKVE
ncbi:MAG: 2-oxoacid:ferredoxin oxidoreductase subunit gamma [Anaerolineaceae bacterium 4572_32.1]|nr:MAG: 2-oxoacid:ferredoxin oxidoreductase subunit gamma [Anaerolineaceae bacterium 4572_32.1]